MTSWRRVPGDRHVTHCAIALSVLDDLTGRPPAGKVTGELDIEDNGGWRLTDIKAVRTPGGLYTYPGLGRQKDVIGQPPTRYRVRFAAQFYRPGYGFTRDGLEFDVPPYNDTNPPAFVPIMPQDVTLFPASNYAFPTYVRVLRGVVRNPAGEPLADAKVSWTTREETLTDEDGAFGLPLRWPDRNGPITIDAHHWLTTMTGSIDLQLPDALQVGHVITVTP